jgi:hypothetical protein
MIRKPKFDRTKSLLNLANEKFGFISIAVAIFVIICIWVFAIARIHGEHDEALKYEIAKNTNLALDHELQVSNSSKSAPRSA